MRRWVFVGGGLGVLALIAMWWASQDSSPAAPPEPAGSSRAVRAAATPVYEGGDDLTAWATRYAVAGERERAVLFAAGAELVAEHRARMREWIETDPARALAERVPYAVRRTLPAELAAQLETVVSAKGFYGVIAQLPPPGHEGEFRPIVREFVTNGRRYEAFVYGSRLRQKTTEQATLWGVALDGKLAVHEEPARRLEREELADRLAAGGPASASCPISGAATPVTEETAAVEVAGELIFLCNGGHIESLNRQLLAADGGDTGDGGGPIAQDTWTQGPKTMLYIRLAFADKPDADPQSETSCYSMLNDVNTFFQENSWGTTAIIPTVTPLLVLPGTEAYYNSVGEYQLRTDGLEVARRAGYDYTSYQLDTVRYSGGPGSFSGAAYVGSRGCWMKTSSSGVAAHEYGHNMGLWHANYWTATGDSVIGPGSNSEYGDSFDVMGNSGSHPNGQFNPSMRRQLEWMSEAYVTTVVTSGTYQIWAFDVDYPDPARQYAMRVRKDADRDYWGGLRRRFTSNQWLLNGLELHWDPWTDSASGTHLLDTTPGSVPAKNDSAVFLGRTFSDLGAGLHFTPIAKTGSGAESALDVVVNVGHFTNNTPPTASLAADSMSVSVGTPVNFTVTAADGDGDTLAYYWDFGDNTYGSNSVNSATVAKAFSAAGRYNVQCVVSDMKGGTARASLLITVGSPATRMITGQILDGTGNPVEGVRLTVGSTTAGYTDSLGNYALPNLAAGTHTIAAVKYGYTFVAVGGWSNPVSTAGGDVAGIDFTANQGQWVWLEMVDDYALETGGDTARLRLHQRLHHIPRDDRHDHAREHPGRQQLPRRRYHARQRRHH
jgi:PKD repeat protein